MLAEHPAEFARSGKVCTKPTGFPVTPFSITNLGLRIELPIISHPLSGFGETYVAVLNCGIPDVPFPLGIHIERDDGIENQFSRVEPHALIKRVRNWNKSVIKVLYFQNRQSPRRSLAPLGMTYTSYMYFSFHKTPPQGSGFAYEKSSFNTEDYDCRKEKDKIVVGLRFQNLRIWELALSCHYFKDESKQWFVLILAAKEDTVWTNVIVLSAGNTAPANADELDHDMWRQAEYMLEGSQGPNDHISKLLPGHRMVSVTTRKTLVSGKLVHDVRISIKPYTKATLLQV